ncbi:hypothetical protein NUW54_g13542 [Trametes sanguinea]|uniref:Uncharacterized protein n=1 Tax=Trametes sanguinea TaxID=158606 RepID=A0ACC1MKW2_9APHY|nr:hypothetical protein NUW54_g13542 [Trametes sanguinea]
MSLGANPLWCLTTRATNHIRSMEDGVRVAANRYRRARIALLALGMDQADPEFRLLRKEDTVKYSLDAQHRTLGESSEAKPWIWERFSFSDTQGDGQYQAFFDEAQRVHWFRSSALRKRWHEEVCLLKEEMQRSIHFFHHHRCRWLDAAVNRERNGNRGAAAYARKCVYRVYCVSPLSRHVAYAPPGKPIDTPVFCKHAGQSMLAGSTWYVTPLLQSLTRY